MNDRSSRHPNALKPVVYPLPAGNTVRIERNLEYHRDDKGVLAIDLYRPAEADSAVPLPCVIFATGFPDVGVNSPLGCQFKEVEMFVSLARLVAASGMAAVAYSASRPADDVDRMLDHLQEHAASLDIDMSRAGLWAWSGHGPLALSTLMRRTGEFRAAILSNTFTLDIEGSTVADAGRAWKFATVEAGRSVEELPSTLPLFVARSGQDEIPGLNEALDRFVGAILRHNLPVTVVNHPGAPHGFEVNDDSERSRCIIAQMIEFMRRHLG